jgi:hypothetical protein
MEEKYQPVPANSISTTIESAATARRLAGVTSVSVSTRTAMITGAISASPSRIVVACWVWR